MYFSEKDSCIMGNKNAYRGVVMSKALTVEETIYQWFDHFHQYPEVSWKEFETTKKLLPYWMNCMLVIVY